MIKELVVFIAEWSKENPSEEIICQLGRNGTIYKWDGIRGLTTNPCPK